MSGSVSVSRDIKAKENSKRALEEMLTSSFNFHFTDRPRKTENLSAQDQTSSKWQAQI